MRKVQWSIVAGLLVAVLGSWCAVIALAWAAINYPEHLALTVLVATFAIVVRNALSILRNGGDDANRLQR